MKVLTDVMASPAPGPAAAVADRREADGTSPQGPVDVCVVQPFIMSRACGPDHVSSSVAPGCLCCRAVPWGEEWDLGSASFWVGQVTESAESAAEAGAGRQGVVDRTLFSDVERHRLGAGLWEELVACMLGGYGVPGDVGVAAFYAVKQAAVLGRDGGRAADEGELARLLQEVLARPMLVPGRPRPVRYRFHQQRPRRIAAALVRLPHVLGDDIDGRSLDDLELRDLLMTLPGVGPKTASWVVRNLRASDEVAIIDVHVRRAGVAAGVFCPSWQLPRHYLNFESAFLDWARVGAVSAADLDAEIWGTLARAGTRGRVLLSGPAGTRLDAAEAGTENAEPRGRARARGEARPPVTQRPRRPNAEPRAS